MFKVSALIHLTGVAGTRILGPYFLPPRLSGWGGGALYHDLLRYVLIELLQDVDLETVTYRGEGEGVVQPHPRPRKSEGPPKSCQTQPDCENC